MIKKVNGVELHCSTHVTEYNIAVVTVKQIRSVEKGMLTCENKPSNIRRARNRLIKNLLHLPQNIIL